ncbi:MAG: Gldg family protein [Anaerolineaceae bacterium]|nr:Gldg family protein [Anaerolineaceae bacterium]
MKQILSITRKELEGYFSSPLAIIFLGTFLAVVLFIFFSVELFFARGIADVRPLFQWMPVLLIFLLASLTMRQWSEEQRSGTLEVLLTLPVRPVQLVLGKFIATMTIIILALMLTLPLPITASSLGNLDWGPVIGGYLAALLMAGAYAAIGLFVSSRTDNQIVALILTMLLGGLFYLVGTREVTDFVGGAGSQILWAIGTGSRFESIERGVIDLRDLIYYLSLTGLFLMLNTISLDSIRWSHKQVAYRTRLIFTSALIGLNLILLNVWMYPLQGLRLDLTDQKEYTISQTTRDMISNLNEPLLMRAYLSEKTHPLLAPLGPRLSDMLREYAIASRGRITVEILDPLTDPEVEAEANQSYGIRPSPFQITGRHEESVINSYFDILIRYGDQSIILNYGDLIEVSQSARGVDVHFRNLEYDLTRSIKKVLYGFQSVDAVLGALDQPVNLTLFVTLSTLPEELFGNVDIIETVAREIEAESNGKLIFQIIDPDDPNSPIDRQGLLDNYGLQPFSVSFFSEDAFYMHMLLMNQDNGEIIYLVDEEISEADVKLEIESALKRISPGFLKVVGVWTQDLTPVQDPYSGQTITPISSYGLVQELLRAEYTVKTVDLSTGKVPAEVEALVLIAPQGLDDIALFAIDQYLMRGGSVIIAASNLRVDVDPYMGGLTLYPVDGGIKEMLEHYGVSVSDFVVMDPQNEPFPVTVMRDAGGFQVQEIQTIDYPYFVDVRPDGMNDESMVISNLPAVTMNWASPVELDIAKNEGREAETLLYSSSQSWLREDLIIQPDFELYPELGFEVGKDLQSYPLAVSVQGSFESFFKGKPSPFLEEETSEQIQPEAPASLADAQMTTIEESPDNSRLVVFGSATFIDDFVLQLSMRLSQDRYYNNLYLLQSSVDWAVEDLDMLSIRSRGSHTRILNDLDESQQNRWEISNYAVALLALIGIYGYWYWQKRNEKPIELVQVSVEKEKGA